MTIVYHFAMVVAFVLICIAGLIGQANDSIRTEAAPPKFVVLVHQRFQFDKTTESGKALAAAARACANLEVPNSWIVSDSVTGEPEVLSFDPFDSFAHVGKAFAEWGSIYAAHPELAKSQAQINGALVSQQTVIAVRRDDLSYRANRIDLSKARFLRVLEVLMRPGHERKFSEAFQEFNRAYEKNESDLPWVVYEVNAGMPFPTFLVFMPMRTLAQNDDLLKQWEGLHGAEDAATGRIRQIAREAYAHAESNLYAISPEKSHVTKEFAAGDPEFWTPQAPAPGK